jgi:hypothetical protein
MCSKYTAIGGQLHHRYANHSINKCMIVKNTVTTDYSSLFRILMFYFIRVMGGSVKFVARKCHSKSRLIEL